MLAFIDPLWGSGYQWWSGLGSDVFILTGVTVGLRHLNCHVRGCWRHGHVVHGTSYRACNRHHPHRNGARITAETIAAEKARVDS